MSAALQEYSSCDRPAGKTRLTGECGILLDANPAIPPSTANLGLVYSRFYLWAARAPIIFALWARRITPRREPFRKLKEHGRRHFSFLTAGTSIAVAIMSACDASLIFHAWTINHVVHPQPHTATFVSSGLGVAEHLHQSCKALIWAGAMVEHTLAWGAWGGRC
jgi:hypothetical protein